MPVVLVMGDAATTTAVALAATRSGPVELVEADGRGGSLAAWWGLSAATTSTRIMGCDIGVRLLPSHPAEADHLVALSDVSAAADRVRIVDAGCPTRRPEEHVWAPVADVAVVVVRQGSGSPRAVATRVDRRAHLVRRLASVVPSVAVAVIGRGPFRPADIGAHLLADAGGSGTVIVAPEDPRAALMIADPASVGERRWRRTALAGALGSWTVPS